MPHSDVNISAFIDHTLLKNTATTADIQRVCKEAIENHFFAVCIPPFFVNLASKILKDTNVKICTVVGFPLGYQKTEVKVLETQLAIKDGADEIDMVLNIPALKDKNFIYLENDIKQVVLAAQKRTVKVILETCLLSENEIKTACEICIIAGAYFVKTSTGFSDHGATPEAVKMIKDTVKNKIKIKASGGIKTRQQAIEYIKLGATRLGTSSGIELVRNKVAKETY